MDGKYLPVDWEGEEGVSGADLFLHAGLYWRHSFVHGVGVADV